VTDDGGLAGRGIGELTIEESFKVIAAVVGDGEPCGIISGEDDVGHDAAGSTASPGDLEDVEITGEGALDERVPAGEPQIVIVPGGDVGGRRTAVVITGKGSEVGDGGGHEETCLEQLGETPGVAGVDVAMSRPLHVKIPVRG
jgi:hypothetical protein